MEHVLIICDKYNTFPSSNGIVASNVVSELSKQNKVVVISLYDVMNFSIGNYGEEVYSLSIKRTKPSFFHKLCSYQQDTDVVRNIENIFSRVHKNHSFKYVISIFRPIESIVAGMNICRKYNIPFVPLFLDIIEFGYSDNLKKSIISYNYRRLYNKITRHSHIFALKDYKAYFEERVCKKDRVVCVGLPSVLENKSEFEQKFLNENKITISYFGCFYRNLRNPKDVLEKLKFIIGSDIQLNFFSSGCENILSEYKNIFGDNLIIHGFQEREKVKSIILSSDFLLNISNDTELQIPGKIYEYFSTGKPIINFRLRKNDAGNLEYNKYPLIYTVDIMDVFDEKAFAKFINDKKNQAIEFSEIEKIYFDCTPKYFIDKIESLLEREKSFVKKI